MELITTYFPDLTDDQKVLFAQLKPLYEDWNSKINVISRKDIDQFYCNHVLHSLAIAKAHDLKGVTKVLDIGTGGGFPGIPLAIMYPDVEFTLVDSITKKTKVIEGVVESLGLKNVSIVNSRFEEITEPFPVIVSRAVAPALKLIKLTKSALGKGGLHIFLKGGNLIEEKNEMKEKFPKMKWTEQNLSDMFTEDFFETKKIVAVKR